MSAILALFAVGIVLALANAFPILSDWPEGRQESIAIAAVLMLVACWLMLDMIPI